MKVRFTARDVAAAAATLRRLGFDLVVERDRAAAFNEADSLEVRRGERDGLADLPLAMEPGAPAGRHANGVYKLERAYVVVANLDEAIADFSARLRLPQPKRERGTVINAELAVFPLGAAALTLARPAGPGIAQEALAALGPGPFQVLYRTRSMEAAARWLARQGVPPPQRGVRNTGEQAMLVPPEHACGAYIGFVGPA